MRYDTKIIFVTESGGKYNPELGEYEESVKDEKVKRANVTDLGITRSRELFGDVRQGAKVVRLMQPYRKRWDYLFLNGDKYEVITSRRLRLKNTFIVQEVAANE